MVWPACRKKWYLTFWNKTCLTINQNLNNKTKFCRPADQSPISSAIKNGIFYGGGDPSPPCSTILVTPRLQPVASRPSFLGSFSSIKLVLDFPPVCEGEGVWLRRGGGRRDIMSRRRFIASHLLTPHSLFVHRQQRKRNTTRVCNESGLFPHCPS